MIIYKYKLGWAEHQVIELPENFKPLRVDFQGKQLCMWAIVDTSINKNNYDFYIVGTGWENDDLSKLVYVSTVFETIEMTNDDMADMKPFKQNFVWHIFYRK